MGQDKVGIAMVTVVKGVAVWLVFLWVAGLSHPAAAGDGEPGTTPGEMPVGPVHAPPGPLPVPPPVRTGTSGPSPPVDGRWLVTGPRPAPVLELAGTRLSGQTGCRRFTARVSGELPRVRIDDLVPSGSCPGPRRRAEARFLAALSATRVLAVSGDRLQAATSQGVVLFEARKLP